MHPIISEMLATARRQELARVSRTDRRSDGGVRRHHLLGRRQDGRH